MARSSLEEGSGRYVKVVGNEGPSEIGHSLQAYPAWLCHKTIFQKFISVEVRGCSINLEPGTLELPNDLFFE